MNELTAYNLEMLMAKASRPPPTAMMNPVKMVAILGSVVPVRIFEIIGLGEGQNLMG